MELRHLRSLIAISEETTFVRAADRLRLAQPALSRQIHSLEKELGTPVFDRSSAGATLTVAGAIALSSARSIVRKVDDAIARTRMADAGRVGEIRIYASFWALWSGFSGRVVAYLAATEPAITLSVEEAGVSGHWGGLISGEIDLAISTKPMKELPNLTSEPLINDNANVALLAKTHRLANRESIRLNELGDEVFLIYDAKTINRVDHDVFASFERAGFTPARIREVSTSEGVIAMVAGGTGWSLHRRSLRGKIPNVAMIPVDGFDLSYPIALVHRADETRPIVFTVAKRIRELAKLEFPELYAPSADDTDESAGVSKEPAVTPQLDLRDLRYFVAVVEEKSIGQAADRLGKSQPAVSRQIAHLERDLGVKLFTRKARGILPTAAAGTLYSDARDILDEADRLPSEVERGQRALAGRCTVAGVPSLQVRVVIASVIQQAAKDFPHLDIVPSNMATPLQPAAIQSGDFDIGLCHPFSHLVAEYPDVDCQPLLGDVIDGALLPVNHPLSSRKMIALSDLRSIPFLFFRRDFHPAFYDYVMQMFATSGYEPIMGALQEGLQTMWSLTAEGQGWSLAFRSQRSDPPAGLVSIPIEKFSIPWGVNILTRKGESRATTVAVIALLHSAADLTN